MRFRGWFVAFAFMGAAHAADEPAPSNASPLGLSFVRTPDMELVYFDPTLAYLEPYAVRLFANALALHERVLGWKPWEQRTTVFLKDFADYGNANATPLPRNTLRFDIAPVSYAFETYGAAERLYSIMNHELAHVATTDVWNERDARWRRLFFGKVFPQWQHPESLVYSYLTVPRFTVPRWYAEGAAVFMETWMSGGLGRVQGGFYEMVFRAMVRDDAHFYDPLGLESRGQRIDFQGNANAYLYGTRFMTYLAYAYSPEKVIQWYRRDPDSEPHYSEQFQHVFGLPLDDAWRQWIAFEHEFQKKNLTQVRAHPITPHRELVPTAVGSSSRAYYDPKNDALIAGFDYPGIVAHIGSLSLKDGSVRKLADIKDSMLYKVTSLAWDPATRTAFYTIDHHALRDIRAVNVDTGEDRELLKDARIGEIVFNPTDRSLIGVRHQNGFATLVRIPYPYSEWKQLYTWAYGIVPFDLDISSDGRLLSASVAEVGGDQYLRVWDLSKAVAGDLAKPVSEFKFGQSVPETFVFTPDGKYLYGSSYYTGVSNIFRYEVATGDVECVSNAESGFFRPVPLADGRLVVYHYAAAGFIPAMIEPKVLKDVSAITFLGAEVAKQHPIVTTWQVASPSSVDDKKLVTDSGAYLPLKRMGLQAAYPVLQGYKKKLGIGAHAFIDDPLDLATIGITASVTPASSLSRDEKTHLDVDYHYLDWHAGLSWNRSDFYDLFGPTIRSRRGFNARGGYDHYLLYDDPRKLQFRSEVNYYNNLDALPGFQNVRATSPRLTTVDAGLYYTDAWRSRGAVDDEKGVLADAVLFTNYAHGNVIPQLRGDFDFGFALPIGHSSIWLRNAAGIAHGEKDDPYANFFFGSFGNNYVDSRYEKRYREYYSFPGFEINEIGGRRFSRHMLEFNIPPYVFESVGTPAFHLAWLRPAVFTSVLWTDPGTRDKARFGNVGSQVDLHFSVLHWYEMTLSAGYAIGYRGSERAHSEWMVSLKIM